MKLRSILRSLPSHEEILGDPDVCIAVLDGPVHLSHPCFAGADLRRIDTLVQDPAGRGPMSVHGTHVASLLFGQPGSPVVGIAPRCRGLILPVFRDGRKGRVTQLDLARAIERAVEEGAHVINISGGERSADGRAESMLDRALRMCEDRGVLVVAAVGNDGCDCLQAPAAAPTAIAVGATDIHGAPLESNNWGVAYRSNGVLAPGQDIEGAAPGNGTVALSGSSFATPAVSGVAALLVAQQLREGHRADPMAAGKAILETAASPPCAPADAYECRRHLVGHLSAARAYDLVGRGAATATERDGETPTAPLPGFSVAGKDGGLTSVAGVNAAGETPSLPISRSEPDERANDMESNAAHPTADEEGHGTEGTAEQAQAVPPQPPPAQQEAQRAEGTSPRAGVGTAGESSVPEANNPGSKEGVQDMESRRASATGHVAPIGHESEITPSVSPAASLSVGGGAQAAGVRPSCGCGGSAPAGCQCGGAGDGSSRQFVYAIGTIGYDFGTEARRDSFRQLMPGVVVPPERPGEVEREVQPNIYDPAQMYSYLAKNPWESDKLIWTLKMDAMDLYALEAEAPVGMDWDRPIITDPRASADMVRKAATAAVSDSGKLADLLETLSYPPVSTVYRTFRDAIVGQILGVDDPNYVSRVSIPGVLTDRTVRTFSGHELPVVEVQSRGLYTWNEARLVEGVVAAVTQDYKKREPSVTLDEDRTLMLRTTVRALIDMVYWQLRNLGQTSADRALNAAGTNAFLVGSLINDGLLSAKHVPGKDDNFYTLDSITVSKSAFGRPGSDCQDVRLEFFDPENERRARVSYLLTFDVGIPYPVSIGPAHKFIGGA
ncbi:S8 family serine peptidase [Streptomyces sp. NPDC006475]|uniref:S8 family serine peptidase n=1 Tax=Streptomyces sp. NPDC006475 TaxID=3155719 RepID=UPI0033A0D6E1